MTMIRELPANPLRTRDARSNGAGLARRATNDVGITGLDRPATGVVGIINGGRGMASPLRVAGPDGMTMIREPIANPLRTRDPRSNGAGLARRATNDVGITGLDRPATGRVGIINGGRGMASPLHAPQRGWMRPDRMGCGGSRNCRG